MAKKKNKTLAEQYDKHTLYELSVQCSEAEIDFVDDTYKSLRNKRAKHLREDFCGTAQVCKEWIQRRKTNTAIGVDLDTDVIHWSRQNHLEALSAQQLKRISLIEDDVISVKTNAQDIILAMNFSYWLFTDRKTLKNYFINAKNGLKNDGMMILDIYGGYDAFREIEEQTEIELDDGNSFIYTWDQAHYDPISGMLECKIHFDFDDGSAIRNAFEYSWRLWTIPEIRELLAEAGFSETLIYWQGFDDNGDADGIFKQVDHGEAEAGWISYIVAQ